MNGLHVNLNKYKAIFCDLDGCLLSGNNVLPGAIELFNAYQDKLWIVSNNSTDTPCQLQQRLELLGISIECSRIILAGTTAVKLIAHHHADKSLKIFGSRSIQQYAIELGLSICNESPDVILLTRDTSFNYRSLVQIIDRVIARAKVYVANPDLTHPGVDNRPVPETGSLLQWLKSCVPDVEFEVIGKPELPLFESGIQQSGYTVNDSLFIGDNELTDGKGAEKMGMDFFHVKNDLHNKGLMDLLEAQ